MTLPAYSIDSIEKSFRRQRVLVSASAWVYPGRKTLLIGRSGCGKTTLLKVGTGQVRASSGMIQCGEWRGARVRMPHLARMGVFLWHDQGLLPYGERVRHMLDTVRHHVPNALIPEAIEMCHIEPVLDHWTHELSGGERRRVELALVVARRPRVVLADEPFLGIMPADRSTTIEVFDWLAGRGAGLLVTGHEVDTLFDMADEVIWMTAGTTHHLGSPEQAMIHDQFRREYFGT